PAVHDEAASDLGPEAGRGGRDVVLSGGEPIGAIAAVGVRDQVEDLVGADAPEVEDDAGERTGLLVVHGAQDRAGVELSVGQAGQAEGYEESDDCKFA